MKQEIITYLAGPRNFIQGVELYEKYGINRMLKKSFRRQGETETMKAILLEELRKLAGLSEREFKTIRRNSKQLTAVKMEPAREAPPDDVSSLSTAQEAQAVVENFIANREMWDELEYYRENGKILGKCEKVKSLSVRKGVENLSDIDIQKALNNARANLSKNKAKLEQAGDDEKKKASALALIQKWETTQKAIEEEIEARKKK